MTLTEFPKLRLTQSMFPPLIAASSLALVTVLPLLQPFYIRISADMLFAALIFQGLLAARLPLFHVLAITALTFAQGGIFLSATGRAGSIWLAIAVICIAQAAAGFVRHRDARRVMVLGAALSLAQVLDPMGAMLAMFLLPVCVGLPRPGEGRHKMGLLALLLFAPVVTALVLAYARGVLGLDPMAFARSDLEAQPIAHASLYFLLLAGFAGAPVLWLTMLVAKLRSAANLITVYTALAALLAMAFAYLLGAERDLATVLTVAAAASAAALCSWRHIERNADLALAATALATVVSWLLLNLCAVVS